MYWVNCQAFFLHRWMISDRLMLEAWISDSNVRFCIKSQERKIPVIRAFIVDIFQILFIQLQETMSLNQSLLFFLKICADIFFSYFIKKNKSFHLKSCIGYWEGGMLLECTYLSSICMCFGLGLMEWNEKGKLFCAEITILALNQI